MSHFEFRLNLGVQVGTAQEQSGKAWMNVKINTKPHGGWCYVTPKFVSSSAEPLFVNCYNWLDDSAIDRFEIYGKWVQYYCLILSVPVGFARNTTLSGLCPKYGISIPS